MRNITKLACWPELEKNGFKPVEFRAHGRVVTIGATDGKITIEPFNYNFSKSYHIYGEVKNPWVGVFYRYDSIGRKQKFFETVDRINEFFDARKILETIKTML